MATYIVLGFDNVYIVFHVAIAAVAICYQNTLFIHIVINHLPTNLLDT